MSKKLHLTFSNRSIPGWYNLSPKSIFKSLPFEDESVDFIYAEHIIEKFNREDGRALVEEIFRILKMDGVVRISTPDLSALCDRYNKKIFVVKKEIPYKSLCQMLNDELRGFERLYVYDSKELMTMCLVNFLIPYRVEVGQSKYNELRNLEIQTDNHIDIVIEAIKPVTTQRPKQ